MASRNEIAERLLGDRNAAPRRLFRKARAYAAAPAVRLKPEAIDEPYKNNLLKAAAAEFVALLVFVFVSAGTAVSLSSKVEEKTDVNAGKTDAALVVGVALGHGITIALTVAVAAAYSGGHVNPAVTLAFILTGRLDFLAGVVYWVAQLLGATVGGFLLYSIWGTKWGLGSHALSSGVTGLGGVGVELALTFVLVLTVWGTAVDPRGNKTLAPYFIGLSVFVAVLFGATLTGPSLNPARTFGVAVWTFNFNHHWVYWLGPFLGAAIASLVYDFLFIRNSDQEAIDEIYEELTSEA
uniref:Major intrinsic family protein n=1 Tax=Zygnema circumcarinatum TaxID=35869 RepID=A0A6M3SLC5_ZYGCR|nr:major intrinsic family protein [Zygnema circumcarinatum]